MTLLKQALTHSSYLKHKPKHTTKSNETLEFLGDAVLELLVREHLFKKYPQVREGKLNDLKKQYTSTDALARIARRLRLGKYLILDTGEERSGGRRKTSNIANSLEALIGALYLDRGLVYTKRFVRKNFFNVKPLCTRDYKSLLNSWATSRQRSVSYRVTKEIGPQHRKIFHVTVYLQGKKAGSGSGKNKKAAEQKAAQAFLKKT